MGANAKNAPSHHFNPKLPPGSSGFAPDVAPSMDFLGIGVQDNRVPFNLYNGSDQTTAVGILGWYGNDPIVGINQVPAAIVVGGIAAAANVVSGVAMTLAGASTGITVITTAARIWPGFVVGQATPLTVSAGLVLDGLPALKRFGSGFVTAYYDRTTMISRAVSITGSTSATGGHFIVTGYDVYGYPMSENITATSGATTSNGKKAFKVVTSVTPQFTDAHNYSCQTTDIFGLPIMALRFSDVLLHWNEALLTASTGFVVADTTSPATTTTGDVRGTYAVQSASDGTKRFYARITPTLGSLQSNPTTGLFGVTQV